MKTEHSELVFISQRKIFTANCSLIFLHIPVTSERVKTFLEKQSDKKQVLRYEKRL